MVRIGSLAPDKNQPVCPLLRNSRLHRQGIRSVIFKKGSERSVTLLCDKVDVNALGKGRASWEHNLLFRFFAFIDNHQAVGYGRQIAKKIDPIFVSDTLAREFPEKHCNSRRGYFPLGGAIID